MHRKVAAFMLACALVSNVARAADIPRTASTSLCGDAYLLALAPERAAALSWQSRDSVSRASSAQRKLPQAWDNPERLIGLGVNHVLFGPGEGGVSGKYLGMTNITSSSLNWGEDFDAVKANYLALGKSVGVQEAALERSAALTKRLGQLEQRAEARDHTPTILYLSRAGGTAGPKTFVDAAIRAAGGKNTIRSAGWVTLDPEVIIALKPDMIVTSFMEDGYESVNTNGLRHEILQKFMNARPQVNIPGALWPCAGPGLIEAAEIIADGLDGLE